MRDPAVEAAQRVTVNALAGLLGPTTREIAAAREALSPIRALIEKWDEYGEEPDLDDLRKLVYPESELQ